MVFWIASAVGLAVAYLLGSTPTGYLAGRLLEGIDIREHGSKSTGATNVLRTLGKWPALAVLLVDVLKGVALGATAVAVGRTALWGLACGGAEGVEAALGLLRSELRIAMALCGQTSVTKLPRDCVFRVD